MKSKIILRMAFLLATALVMVTCTKSDIEKARDAYKPSLVVPEVLGITGSTTVLQTFQYSYSPNYYREGSTWAWTGVDCVVDSVSKDTRKAYVKYTTKPASDTAKVKVIETTIGGAVSAEKIFKVKVNPFCPVAMSGFVGSWSGTDGTSGHMYSSQVVTSNVVGRTIKVTGLNKGWMEDYWGETITAGGTITMTIAENGVVTIADQYFETTDYAGDPYIYWIKDGTGTWDGCGAKPKITFTYKVYYKSDGSTAASGTATLTLI